GLRPSAGWAGEAVERERKVLLAEAGPVVADRERPRVKVDPDCPSGRAPLSRVVEQIGHGPRDPVAVAVDQRGFEAGVHDELGGPSPGALDLGLDDLVQAR